MTLHRSGWEDNWNDPAEADSNVVAGLDNKVMGLRHRAHLCSIFSTRSEV